MEKSLYIKPNATFDDLVTFSRKIAVGGNRDAVKVTSTSEHASHRLPDFKVPRFNDDTIEGDDFIKNIERTFKSHALSRYLADLVYFEAIVELSSALASRIWERLSESSNLNFLVKEQESENNCRHLFLALGNHLSTVDMSIVKTFDE